MSASGLSPGIDADPALSPRAVPQDLAQLVEQDPAAAAARLRLMLDQDRRNTGAWRLLGRALRLLGQDAEAAEAEIAAVRSTAFDPEMIAIAAAMLANDLPQAEQRLRQRLREQPLDVAAIRMMAELAARIGRLGDAETLLRRALELAPGFSAARANLATVLYKQHRFGEAAAQLEPCWRWAVNPSNQQSDGRRARPDRRL